MPNPNQGQLGPPQCPGKPFGAGQTNALWTFVPTSGGHHQIKNVNGGKVVNVSGASGINGATIVQWPVQG